MRVGAIVSVHESLHAEDAAAGFFEFGSLHHDRRQPFLRQDVREILCHARRNEFAIHHDPVPYELRRFLPAELVNALETLTNGL